MQMTDRWTKESEEVNFASTHDEEKGVAKSFTEVIEIHITNE